MEVKPPVVAVFPAPAAAVVWAAMAVTQAAQAEAAVAV
jgi:hypothetical protein